MRYLIILLLLSGCAGKDINFNPWTTILNQIIKAEGNKNVDAR
jgi:hypothetical protein